MKAAQRSPSKPDYSHAIETAYRKFMFRSRLEAKWAAFFDLCEWPWSYEPKDFNGWIPDFAIGKTATLVEVKPFFHRDEWDESVRKIVDSGCREHVILLGADPTWNLEYRSNGDDYDFGELIENYFTDTNGNVCADRSPLHFGKTEKNNMPGLCPMCTGWWNPIWDFGGKDARVELLYEECEQELVSRWAAACNASRWMKVQK